MWALTISHQITTFKGVQYYIPSWNLVISLFTYVSHLDKFRVSFSNSAALIPFVDEIRTSLKGSSDLEHLGLEKFFSHIVGVFQIDFFKTLYFVLSWCIMEMIFLYVSQWSELEKWVQKKSWIWDFFHSFHSRKDTTI